MLLYNFIRRKYLVAQTQQNCDEFHSLNGMVLIIDVVYKLMSHSHIVDFVLLTSPISCLKLRGSSFRPPKTDTNY